MVILTNETCGIVDCSEVMATFADHLGLLHFSLDELSMYKRDSNSLFSA